MNPSKYEGSILEDDIEEEPFTIVEKKDMKTLEQVIREASEDFGHPAGVVGDEEASVIASAVREWMKEQNGGLRDVIGKTLNDLVKQEVISWVTNSPDPLATDAILSVIPPPRDEMFKAAIAVYESRIKELKEECKRLDEIRTLLDKLRPIRRDQEARINEARSEISRGSANAFETLRVFLEEMQKAKAIHAEIDTIVEPSAQKTVDSLKEFSKRSSEATVMIDAKPVSAGISPAEADDLDDVRKRCKELEDELARAHEELGHPEIVHKIREKAAKYDALCETFPYLGHPEVVRIIREKANKYDELREKFPFLPGEEFWAFHLKAIRKFEVASVWRNGTVHAVYLGSKVEFDFRDCYPTAEDCRATIKVEE